MGLTGNCSLFSCIIVKENGKHQIEEPISKLKWKVKQPTGNVLQNAKVKACLSDLQSMFFVQADKALKTSLLQLRHSMAEILI